MSCILHIETSTEVCSVAISEDGQSIFSQEDFQGQQHAVKLGVFVDEALSFADSHAIPVDAVAVSCGRGWDRGGSRGGGRGKGRGEGRKRSVKGGGRVEGGRGGGEGTRCGLVVRGRQSKGWYTCSVHGRYG